MRFCCSLMRIRSLSLLSPLLERSPGFPLLPGAPPAADSQQEGGSLAAILSLSHSHTVRLPLLKVLNMWVENIAELRMACFY